MRKSKLAIGICLVMVFCFLFSACSTNTGTAPSATAPGTSAADDSSTGKLEVIKVAFEAPLSGAQAKNGEILLNGGKMAYEDWIQKFKDAGFDLQLVVQDDQADPKLGVSIAQMLVEDKAVLAVSGYWNSSVIIPATEVLNKASLAVVAPTTSALAVTDRGYPTVNRIATRDDVQGPLAALYAFEDLKCATAFVIHDKTAYGQGSADQFKTKFESLGGKTLGYEAITPGDTDFSSVVNQLAATNPDIVFFGGYYTECGLILKQARARGVTSKFIAGDALDTPDIIDIAGADVVGLMHMSLAVALADMPDGAQFIKDYEAKYNSQPASYAAIAYDTMDVALNGIMKAIVANNNEIPTREMVAQQIRDTKNYEGRSSMITFNVRGDNEDAFCCVVEYTEMSYPGTVLKSIPVKDYLAK